MAYSWQGMALLGIRLWPCECRFVGANGNTAQSGGTDNSSKPIACTVAGNSGAACRSARIYYPVWTFMSNSARYVIDFNIARKLC